MPRLILLLAILAIGYLLYQWASRTPREKLIRAARKYALWIAGGVLVLLVLTGRMPWLFAAVAAAIPLFQRGLSLLRFLPLVRRLMAGMGLAGGAAAGGGANGQSSIQTRYLDVRLDHASGDMHGAVLEGSFAGQQLSALNLDQLRSLYREVQVDPQSQRVLQAYLERMHGEDWQPEDFSRTGEQQAVDNGDLSAEDAAAILGIDRAASIEEIRSAHRSLIQKLHPDRGGSAWLATRVNLAKDLLIKLRNAD